MPKLKSITQILIAFFVFFLYTPTPAFAQAATNSATLYTPIPTYVSPTSPLYTDLLVNNLFHSFSCLAVGQSAIGQPCLSYQITKNTQGTLQSVPVISSVNLSGGVLGTTSSLIGALFENPPVRTADYLASISGNFGAVKEAHAQVGGSGSSVLNPILGLWQVSRNISYVFMIIIFLIIGLMIIFRNKINPQTVITAQAALPGLIIGLIMITFSYFFAGLISDVAFLGTNIVGYYFSAVRGQADTPQNLVQEISGESSLSIFTNFLGIVTQDRAHNVVGAIFDKMDAGTKANLRVVLGFITAQFFAPITQGIPPPIGLVTAVAVPIIAGGLTAADPATTLSFIIPIIAGFILIYAMLRLLMRLVSSYLTIIFLTISAPFQFLAAALPGRQNIATGWMLNLLANVLAFPAVLAVFYFVAFILAPLQPGQDFGPLKVSDTSHVQNNNIVPIAYAAGNIDIINSFTFPLFGGMNLEFIRMLLAFGALVALPAIPEIVARTVGKVSQAGQLIGQEVGAGTAGGQKYAGQYRGAATQTAQGTLQGTFGQRDYRWVPDRGMEYGLVKPGVAQLIDRNNSWKPWNWTRKRT